MTSGTLNLEPNFDDADAFFAALTDLFSESSASANERINARLVLLLANHVGTHSVLMQALEIAGQFHQGDNR
jgi:hypothetical protein